MKTIKLLSFNLICFLFIIPASVFSIGTGKSLIVELFGTNIFNVDEDGITGYEREEDLINYCSQRNYNTIILNRLHTYPGFSRSNIITSSQAIDTRLGEFIAAAHAAGITKVGAQDRPVAFTFFLH